jgi:hypothetical protein
MIKFSLKCRNGHEFESWFQSGAAFDEQVGRSLVACPICDSAEVSKAIMAPALVLQGQKHPDSAPAGETPRTPVALLDEKQQEQLAVLRTLRQKILAETDNVGDRFPEEARRMHEGLIPERGIHGQATLEEAKTLLQEGIGIVPLPVLPDDFN